MNTRMTPPATRTIYRFPALVLAAIGALTLPLNPVVALEHRTPEATASTWTVDGVHSAALFRVRHGPGAFWGRFNDVSGTATFDPASISSLQLDIHVPIKGVDSGHPDLDKHLRSADFFNEIEFPEMVFTSTKVEPSGKDTFTLQGTVSLLGHKAPIQAELTYLGMADSGKHVKSGFEAMFTLKRSEFGMSYGITSGLGDDIRVIVALELVQIQAPPAAE